jgi:membrane protein
VDLERATRDRRHDQPRLVGGHALVVTGPVARAIGDVIGLGSTAVGIWNVAKWPALVLIVMFTFALLYHTAPNVRPRRFRILTWGSAIAVLLWIAASAAFAV